MIQDSATFCKNGWSILMTRKVLDFEILNRNSQVLPRLWVLLTSSDKYFSSFEVSKNQPVFFAKMTDSASLKERQASDIRILNRKSMFLLLLRFLQSSYDRSFTSCSIRKFINTRICWKLYFIVLFINPFPVIWPSWFLHDIIAKGPYFDGWLTI